MPGFLRWLSHGDNAFHLTLIIFTPPLLAIIWIGFFG